MVENLENKILVKRGRGRPKKVSSPVEKLPVGRPKKYEHRYLTKNISYKEYEKLKEIEKKFCELTITT